MAIELTENFSDGAGRFLNYDSYLLSDRDLLDGQKHVDIRSFIESDSSRTPVLSLGSLSMSDLSAYTVSELENLLAGDVENWTDDPEFNLVTNPSIEVTASDWTHAGTNPSTWARTAANPYSGTYSLRMAATWANSSNFTEIYPPLASAAEQRANGYIVGGTSYKFIQRVYSTTAPGGDIICYFDWADVNGSAISTSSQTIVDSSTGNRTNTFSATAPANARSVSVRIRWYGFGGGSSVDVYMDGFQLGEITTYFDGASANGSWMGTANASVSKLSRVLVKENSLFSYYRTLEVIADAAGSYSTQSIIPNIDGSLDSVDILSNFGDNDFISIGFPSYPKSSLTESSCFVDLTSNTTGDFTAGPTASVALSSSLVTMNNATDSEFRVNRSAFNQNGIDLSNVTGVRLRFVTTGAATITMLGGIRLLASTWQRLSHDINTRQKTLVRTPPIDGNDASLPVAPLPFVLRSDIPSGNSDPKPIDSEVGILFYTGNISGSNAITLYFREQAKDFLTQVDLNGYDQSTFDGLPQPDIGEARFNVRTQGELAAFIQSELRGDPQSDLARSPDSDSQSWISFTIQWDSSSGIISMLNTEGGGYTVPISALSNNTTYMMIAKLENTSASARIFEVDSSNILNEIFYTTVANDDFVYKRRPGRFGWQIEIPTANAWVDSISDRGSVFAEYRSAPLRSITPVRGAQLFSIHTSDKQLFTEVGPGPFNTDKTMLSSDTRRSTTGSSTKITPGAYPNQGIQTNVFSLKDFKNTSIAFDIYTSSEDVDVYLSNRNNTFFRSLQNTPIKTNQWQSIKVDFPYDIVLPTGDYRLLVLVGPSVLSEWWIDNVSISEKAVAWDGRAVVDDPWESNNAAWTPFKNALGGTSGVVFNQRGSELQIRGRGLSTDATISKIQIKPNYSELGRLNEFASPALVPPVANFTGTPTGLTVAFTSTAADGDGEIINQEWQFGDGSYGSGRTPSHTYASAGNYWVTLIVMDNQGNFDSYTDTVTV